MSWRKLAVLVPQLPPESATTTAHRLAMAEAVADGEVDPQPAAPRDPNAESWSRDQELLASIRDELHFFRWMYLSAKSDKHNQPKWKPEPISRPGVARAVDAKRPTPEQLGVLAQHLQATQGDSVTYN